MTQQLPDSTEYIVFRQDRDKLRFLAENNEFVTKSAKAKQMTKADCFNYVNSLSDSGFYGVAYVGVGDYPMIVKEVIK